MPEPQTQESTSSPDIASLTGGDKGLLDSFIGLDKRKAAEDTAITAQSDKRMAQDQGRLDAAYKQEGVTASELPKPWNADEQHKKYEANPIEGFGSVGGLFAMVASAFTKAPMENAINGMAGAINAIKDGKEADYARAHEAWKDNTKLALDRFKTQHELYSDAMSLMDHDTAAANAKLHNAAVRFGDSQMLMLAEHGMVKEMFELQASRANAAEQMLTLSEKMDERAFTKTALTAMQKGFQSTGDQNKDKIILATQALKILKKGGQVGSAEQEAIGQYVMTHQPSDPDFAAGLADVHQQFSPKAPNIESYQNAKQQWRDAHDGAEPPAEEDAKMLAQAGLTGVRAGTTGTGTSSQAIKAHAIQEILDKHKADGKPISTAEAEHEYNLTRSTPTGNQVDALQGRIDQAERVMEGSDKNLDFLHTYKGGAGLMGKIMRGEEIAENITGISTQTDRVAFRRRVNELQEMAPRILVDANGRPLKAEQDKVADIVAGLQAGDTSPNTIRAYEDLIQDMKTRVQKYRERQGKAPPTSGAPSAPTGNADWLTAYPEK
jgi:hypothetical protein